MRRYSTYKIILIVRDNKKIAIRKIILNQKFWTKYRHFFFFGKKMFRFFETAQVLTIYYKIMLQTFGLLFFLFKMSNKQKFFEKKERMRSKLVVFLKIYFAESRKVRKRHQEF